MEPLIQGFTKTLQPCSGCGKNGVDYFVQRKKGEQVKFILQVEVTTDTDDDDLFSLANTDRTKWKVISGGPVRVNPGQAQSGGTQFSQTRTVTTP